MYHSNKKKKVLFEGLVEKYAKCTRLRNMCLHSSKDFTIH